ncbi:MAG: hypothetical protein ACREAC_03915, partial [Blastocatellia bacterium]
MNPHPPREIASSAIVALLILYIGNNRCWPCLAVPAGDQSCVPRASSRRHPLTAYRHVGVSHKKLGKCLAE